MGRVVSGARVVLDHVQFVSDTDYGGRVKPVGMNIPSELFTRLDLALFNDTMRCEHVEQTLSWLADLARGVGTGFGIGMVVAALLCLAMLLGYRPRMRRGSLWAPMFGVFGGTPTLYLHTRPASVCGFFSHSRRLKSRH